MGIVDLGNVRGRFRRFPSLATAPPLQATISLPPGASRSIPNFLPELFGLTAGQGALLVTSNVPVATGVRIAARQTPGDYGGFAAAIDGASGISGGSATAVGLPQTATLRSNLLLFNRGLAGSITVTGFRADGSQAGQLTLEIGDHAVARINSVFTAFGITNQPGGRIRVDVPSGMNVYAWTADVDGHSSDIDLAPLR